MLVFGPVKLALLALFMIWLVYIAGWLYAVESLTTGFLFAWGIAHKRGIK